MPEHECRRMEEGWKEAKILRRSANLLAKDDKEIKVAWISKRTGEFRVYNFEVANANTYFVSNKNREAMRRKF